MVHIYGSFEIEIFGQLQNVQNALIFLRKRSQQTDGYKLSNQFVDFPQGYTKLRKDEQVHLILKTQNIVDIDKFHEEILFKLLECVPNSDFSIKCYLGIKSQTNS